jgi:L-ectoine synthase
MIVRSIEELDGTDRDVEHSNWRSRRLILARDGVGFSLHETVMHAGTEATMWYANHVEAVYCIAGEAELTDHETGRTYRIVPGTMYLLDGHERHTVRVASDLRTVCVFNPPVTGREVHDERGVYPLLADDGAETADDDTEVTA